MGMLKEFKEFAMKGNLVDMAVAFVMGGAFGAVSKNFIDGIVMPPISLITGGDMSSMKMVLRKSVDAIVDANGTETAAAVSEVAIKYGDFISALINFIIVAFVMFLVVKAQNASKKPVVEAPAGPTQEQLLAEIRDLLKK
ncbi:MAG: large conductance mechanosensitive channel protein MscL [Chitinophagales bacterium]|nr:large conductance mechanosensitive channel protein MscL [Chitinophagales bacterium]